MRPPTGMYRTPRDPGGFPFEYDWRATGTGLILLVGFNLLATQYAASKFRYQPALGTPLIRTSRMAVYQPFAWCIWGYRNCATPDIFVSGHFPILGMQMLYFADPELARRSAIAPPAASERRIPAPPPIRIDKPEIVTEDDATTGLERGFIEELRHS